jgi:hypothetical protein
VFVTVSDPELLAPGDSTAAVTPVGSPPTLAVRLAFDPDRVTVIAIAVDVCSGNVVTAELPSVNANCGPVTCVPELPPHPAARGSNARNNPTFFISGLATRKPTTNFLLRSQFFPRLRYVEFYAMAKTLARRLPRTRKPVPFTL